MLRPETWTLEDWRAWSEELKYKPERARLSQDDLSAIGEELRRHFVALCETYEPNSSLN